MAEHSKPGQAQSPRSAGSKSAARPQPGASLNHWTQSMQEQLAVQRQRLQATAPEHIARQSGATWEPTESGGGQLSLRYLQMPLVVRIPEYSISIRQGEAVSLITEALVLAYLELAAGAPRAGEWVAFRDLPGGTFYHQAFTGYTGRRLAQHFGDDLETFRRGAAAVGGALLGGLGDAAYEFQALPRLWLAVVYWLGDPEDGFPAQANVLFDRVASQYLVLDGLAILGSQLVSRIIRASEP